MFQYPLKHLLFNISTLQLMYHRHQSWLVHPGSHFVMVFNWKGLIMTEKFNSTEYCYIIDKMLPSYWWFQYWLSFNLRMMGHIWTSFWLYVCECEFVCMHICLCICICRCMCICICMHTCLCMCLCKYMCMCMCMCMCMFMRTCIWS